MKNKNFVLAIALCVLAFVSFAGQARAQLNISGNLEFRFTSTTGGPSILNTNGVFSPSTDLLLGPGGEYSRSTVILNSAATPEASWITVYGGSFTNLSVPQLPLSVLTPVGIPVAPGLFVDFNIFNGNAHGNTSVSANVYVHFTAPVATEVQVATITFNLPPAGGTGYTESIVYTPSFTLAGQTVVFGMDNNISFTIAPDGTKNFGDNAFFSLVAVPEPSTYALFGAMALMGVVAVRRFRNQRTVIAVQ